MGRAIHILDLVSRKKLERILDVFTEVAGVASIITYPGGRPITYPHNFTSFCRNYCRATKKGRIKCFESDRFGGTESIRLRSPFTYQCLNGGLTDCAVPVVVDGHHLATVLCGQVLPDPVVDYERSSDRAKEIGIEDIDGYLKELENVPVMSAERLLTVVNLMAEITVTISELALQKHIAHKNSQLYLSRLVNSVSDCIVSADVDDKINMINQAGAAMFGYEESQIIGRAMSMLVEQDKPRSDRFFYGAAGSCGNWRADLAGTKADGSRFPVQVSFSTIDDGQENKSGYVGVIRDISEEKKVEKLKEDLIGMITHDLRNPVLSMERALQIVSDGTLGTLNAGQKELTDLALVTCRQLYGMVSDLLDIYRNEGGCLIMRFKQTEIQRLIEQGLKQMELLTREKRIEIILNSPQTPVFANVDEGRILRTFVNLLDNAIKYSHEGGRIVIGVQLRQEGGPSPGNFAEPSSSNGDKHSRVLLSIEDEGIGIPEEYQQSIFDKFFTLKTSGTTYRDGVGLGLAFCKLTVEAHGGKIWVESPIHKGADLVFDRGCCFFFTLPL